MGELQESILALCVETDFQTQINSSANIRVACIRGIRFLFYEAGVSINHLPSGSLIVHWIDTLTGSP
jgi:hypothetical protein